MTTFASAQQTPANPDSSDMPYGQHNTQGDVDQTYDYGTSTTVTTPTPAPAAPTSPPAGSVTTSTTTTTAAEYNEMAGAEQTKTVRPNVPMLGTGAALLVLPYGASVITAAQSDLDSDNRLYIPVVGPWLDFADRPCRFGCAGGGNDTAASILLIADGVAQGAGALIALASLAVPEQKTEKIEAKPEVHVLPVSYAGGAGVGAVGTF
jgi:hypothetical protein